MIVLHTESSTGWGGQENRTLQEAQVLRSLGARVLFLGQPGARLLKRAQDAGFDVFSVWMRSSFDFSAIYRIRKILGRVPVNIVNTHSGRDSLLAGLAGQGMRRLRIVRTRHLILPISSKLSYNTLPHHVVAVSQAVKRYLVSAGVSEAKITAIPTGIDPSVFDPTQYPGDIRQELELASGTPLVGTVAILRFKKGHRTLLDAVPLVLKVVPDAHFVFAGDGPQTEELRALIASKRLGDRVHLLGLRHDIPNVLKSLDLFVLPTLEEALGTALLEAQAMGVPVIGSKVGGVPEALSEGETGLLVPPQDAPALANSIGALLQNPARRSRMAAAARPWVLSRYTNSVMGKEMHSLYLKLLEQAG